MLLSQSLHKVFALRRVFGYDSLKSSIPPKTKERIAVTSPGIRGEKPSSNAGCTRATCHFLSTRRSRCVCRGTIIIIITRGLELVAAPWSTTFWKKRISGPSPTRENFAREISVSSQEFHEAHIRNIKRNTGMDVWAAAALLNRGMRLIQHLPQQLCPSRKDEGHDPQDLLVESAKRDEGEQAMMVLALTRRRC